MLEQIDEIPFAFGTYADEKEREGTWHGKSILFWYLSLIEEVTELGLSLVGLHEHPAEFELKQVSSVAMNFTRELRRRKLC